MTFTEKFQAMNTVVRTGNLEQIKTYVNSLQPQDIRPIVESAVCLGFNTDVKYDILFWLTTKIGTLKISQMPSGVLRLSRNFE